MRDYIHVNLLPIEYRVVKKDYSFLVDWRAVMGTLILLFATLVYFVGKELVANNLASKTSELAVVQEEINRNGYVATKIQELEKLRDEKNAKNNSLKSISVNKRKWVRILESLSKSMPLNTWLDLLKQSEADAHEMEIKGRTLVFPEVAQYMLELEKGEYFQKVSLNAIEFQKEKDQSFFVFNLKIRLNPNAGMESFIPVEPKSNGGLQ